MTRAYLGLGSNLGDRLARLQRAVDRLAAEPRVEVVAVSAVYETEPIGGPVQDDFYNAVVGIDTDLDPHELLALGQRLEKEADRVKTVHWGPRTLDVDVLLYGDERIETADLTIPHPLMWERDFVLAPLRDVAPDLVAARTWQGVRPAPVTLVVPRHS